MIMSGSFSRIIDFESCARKAELKYVTKVVLPPPEKESPLDRGSRIHTDAELFVRGEQPLSLELKNFEPELTKLKEEFAQGRVILEEMWCYDNAWQPIPSDAYDQTWLRIKMDACWFLEPSHAILIDYKTGKRVNNEVKHNDQLNLYQLGAFLKYPELERVTCELYYIDQDEVPPPRKFTRKQGMKFLKGFNERMLAMTQATEFPPRPSVHHCMFCPYKTGRLGKRGPMGTGHCDLNPI